MTIEVCRRGWRDRPGEFGEIRGTVKPGNNEVFPLNSTGTVAEITGTEDGGQVIVKEGPYDNKATVAQVALNDGEFFMHGKHTFYGHHQDRPMPTLRRNRL